MRAPNPVSPYTVPLDVQSITADVFWSKESEMEWEGG